MNRYLLICLFSLVIAGTASISSAQSNVKENVFYVCGGPIFVCNGMHAESPEANQPLGSASSFSLTLDSTVVSFNNSDDHTIHGTLKNLTNNPLQVSFMRDQIHPPFWSSSICFGTLCYSQATDSAVTTLDANASTQFILHINNALEDQPDSASVNLTLRALNGDLADSVRAQFRGYFTPPSPPLLFLAPPDSTYKYSDGTSHAILGSVKNLSGGPLDYKFSVSTNFPAGWTYNLSLGSKHLSHAEDSATVQIAKKPSLQLLLVVNNPASSKRDSGTVTLTIRTLTSNAADFATYRYTVVVEAQSGVAQSAKYSDNLRIYPCPLLSGHTLNLELSNSNQTSFHFTVVDVVGRIVLQGNTATTGTIGQSNLFALDIGALAPGSYRLQLINSAGESYLAAFSIVR